MAVVGAGVFGAWTAWHLRERGLSVALVDAHGPGHSRASSGGETRVIRMGYGSHEIYTRWSVRSLALWKELSARANDRLFHDGRAVDGARAGPAVGLDPADSSASASRTSGWTAPSWSSGGRRSTSGRSPGLSTSPARAC